ncbi:MAG: putative zinc-binding protein, partial [Candidatus Humimicrobiaceae bacterium]
MENSKEVKKGSIAVVACSGASNTGQITNEVAKNLCKDAENFTMVCLAALPLG